MTIEEAKIKFKKIMEAEWDRLPSHYDSEINEEVFDDTSQVDELLKLNKIICEALEQYNCKCEDCKHADLDDYPRWVSVTEGLPESNKAVLVQWKKVNRVNNSIEIYLNIGMIDEYKWCHADGLGIINGEVVAWMPLPETI